MAWESRSRERRILQERFYYQMAGPNKKLSFRPLIGCWWPKPTARQPWGAKGRLASYDSSSRILPRWAVVIKKKEKKNRKKEQKIYKMPDTNYYLANATLWTRLYIDYYYYYHRLLFAQLYRNPRDLSISDFLTYREEE